MGYVLYDGPSRVDQSPIIVILTDSSKNVKTGDMLQTWILQKDLNPIESIKIGLDKGICGNCIHRGNQDIGRSCYVNVGQAPLAVYKKFINQGYLEGFDPTKLKGKSVRLGSYGDPCAVPKYIWTNLLKYCKSHTAYSHAWKLKKNQHYKDICMASVDSESEAQLATQLGWRYFRVRLENQPVLEKECICPASKEGGFKTTCSKCLLCKGLGIKAKSVTILAHGGFGVISNIKKRLSLL